MALKNNADLHREYPTEPLARAAFLKAIKPHMDVIEQVELKSVGGDDLRIDAVAVCKKTGWLVGCELKHSHLLMSEFSKALYQAAQYQDAKIVDSRFSNHQGEQLPVVGVFPDWRGMHDEGKVEFDREAKGMRIFASQFRVGGFRTDKHQGLILDLGENRLWSAGRGWIANAESILFGKRSIGSQRKPR